MEQNGIWAEDYKIRAFMVDTTRKATLPTICNFLQDVAGNHANFRNVGYYDMQAQGKFWVLNRLRVAMTRFPDWQETITVKTWVSLMKGPFSYRNFELLAGDERIGAAGTLWISLDAEKRKPARVDWKDLPVLPDKPSICGNPEKIMSIKEPTSSTSYRVRYSDLDMIEHVNNVKYIEWVLDSYENRPDGLSPKLLEVNFLNEMLLGQSVNIHTQLEGEHIFKHSLQQADGTETTRLKIDWQ